ncbi:ABC transporter ATP-binding protein [Jiulongibacter sediminis]|uniref:ABC transporter ATP-binding protein n=1 Tax=Jiulongibacter sediminis TaxID=1605367 RepID=A0A0P7C8N7_9BACT|nr:ABC transporter ATP-binding protein [Jiulongibacter sediminis]KPM50046.1 ABC transporter ATP-binding protein [Jiulongibacter sediminis]TBX27072.1 ABC transporter ATP-binding protein [Jiulongibacter sediminis]
MNTILDIKNIVKNYANHLALDDVSITVPKGMIFGLLGPNGAGKTSLIRIVNQITAPDSGKVFFDGEPLSERHIYEIGYLPEERGLYKKMKVGDLLLYLARLKGLSKSEAMDKLKEWFIKFDIKNWWDKPVEDLSKGMQQKIQFVATVLHQPKLIILDEPFSGFDPINANIIKDEILKLREQGSTIIFSTHRMESVEELCDHVALINKSKKVLDGSKAELKEQFKENSFHIEFDGKLESKEGVYQIEKVMNTEGNHYSGTVKLAEGVSVNDLIRAIIDQVELKALHENIPTMNDIFIKAVNQA